MTDEDITGLKEMSLEELESFVNSGGNTEENKTETQQEDTTEANDTNLIEETDADIENDNDADDSTEDPDEDQDDTTGQTEEDDIPEFYRGKSPKDLINIIEENKKFTSRQGNEIGSLKSQLANFQNQVEKKLETFTPTTKAEKKQFLDELQEQTGYNKDELEIIAKIASHQVTDILQKTKETERQKTEQERAVIGAENQNLWDTVKDLYPNSHEIESAMLDQIRRDSQNTVYKKGWVKSFLKSYQQDTPTNQTRTGDQVKSAVKKRIVKTQTVKGTTPKKHIESIKREDLNSSDPEVWRRAHNHFNPGAKLERI